MSLKEYQIGDSLPGGYRVIHKLSGGMGVVYICHQRTTDELYAIKTIRLDGSPDEVHARHELFIEEVRRWIHISNTSNNPHLVKARSYNEDERFLILEFVDGLPLNKVVEPDRTIHVVHALSWAKQIAKGLNELHTRFHLLHRDMKPANVLLHAIDGEEPVAKITDFGITRFVSGDPDEPATMIGTPAYMAPEVEHGRTDYRSDIYSFGVTFAWMLSGSRTFEIEPEALPDGLHQLVERCLQRNPARRYQSFDEILTALDGIDPGPVSRDEPGYHFCRLHRYLAPLRKGGLTKARHVECPFCIERRKQQNLESDMIQMPVGDATVEVHTLPSDEPLDGPTIDPNAGGADGEGEPTGATLDSSVRRREPGSTQPGSPTTGPRPVLRLAVVAVALVLGVWLIGRDWTDAGGKPSPSPPGLTGSSGPKGGTGPADPGVSPAAAKSANGHDAVAKRCAEPGCEREVPPRAREAEPRSWEPKYCSVHAPFECPTCGHTYHASDVIEGITSCEVHGKLLRRRK